VFSETRGKWSVFFFLSLFFCRFMGALHVIASHGQRGRGAAGYSNHKEKGKAKEGAEGLRG
jgi:hypothetical protein